MALTGDPVPAAVARDWGLVNDVVPAGQVLSRALELARRIADNAPASVQDTKKVPYQGPEVVAVRNARLVYGRMTSWGRDGPAPSGPGTTRTTSASPARSSRSPLLAAVPRVAAEHVR